MALKQPDSMEELVYYTYRDVGETGEARVWVFRKECPECGKDLMGKPLNKKGKPKVRAKKYVCYECEHEIPKKDYEEQLTANVEYTCPKCGHEGEAQVPFKRKKIKGVKTLRVECGKCEANIDITKKMKKPK